MHQLTLVEGIVYLIMFAIMLALLNEVFRRKVKIALFFFITAPLVGLAVSVYFPHFSMPHVHTDWFVLVKLFSACFAGALIFILIFLKAENAVFFNLIRIIFSLNILQASMSATSKGYWINGIAGFALALSPDLWRAAMKIGSSKNTAQLSYDLPISWSIAYSLWNIVFIYLCYPHVFHLQIVVLLIPLLIAIAKTDFWGQARVTTLSLWLFFNTTLYPVTSLAYTDRAISMTPWAFAYEIISTLIVLSIIFRLLHQSNNMS